jgi:hypothetical protein
MEENTEIGLKDVGWKGVEWIHMARDRDQWRASVIRVMSL